MRNTALYGIPGSGGPSFAQFWRVALSSSPAPTMVSAAVRGILYHIMLGISMSSDTMAAFGEMSDGISMYSASVVSHRMYYMFSIYSWLQILVATMTTGSVFMFLKPLLGERTEESAPEFLGTAQGIAGTGVELGTSKGLASAAKAVL